MPKRPRNPDHNLPQSKRVSDAIGQLGLGLMTLGVCVGLWKMLTGREHATTGQMIGMTVLTLGMLWLNVYLWRHPAKPIGNERDKELVKPLAALPTLDLRYRQKLSAMDWLLVCFTAMGVLSAGALSLALPRLWPIFAGLGAVYVLGMCAIIFRGRARKGKGVVVRIDARGIRDQRSAKQGLVPWCDIHHLEVQVVRSSRNLVVWFYPDSQSRAKPGWRLHLRHAGAWADGSSGDWFIDLDELDCSAHDVERQAVQMLAAWRHEQSAAQACNTAPT